MFLDKLLNESENSGLIIGKFRVLSIAHANLIKQAVKECGHASVVIVTGKATLESQKLRKLMLKAFIDDELRNKVEIIEYTSADLVAIKALCKFNPIAVYCGTDRVKGYECMSQKYNLGLEVKETARSDEDISATRIIANINDKKFFNANTPKAIHPMYNAIASFYSVNEEWDQDTEIDEFLESFIEYFDDVDNVDDVHGLNTKNQILHMTSDSCDDDESCDSVGTGTADIAHTDNIVGAMVKRKYPEDPEYDKSDKSDKSEEQKLNNSFIDRFS